MTKWHVIIEFVLLFQRYPDVIAQAVYCTFCTAFPTSYKQFGDEFKESLIQIIHEWIAGKSFVHDYRLYWEELVSILENLHPEGNGTQG